MRLPRKMHLSRSSSNVPRLHSFVEMLQHNPLRLPRETTSEPPKVVHNLQFLTLLAWKCASRHNGVHFFDISTSKSAPRMACFVPFDLEMCFAPQPRTLFEHLNVQSCSERVLNILAWKRASRHNGVHFFNMSTSKSGPILRSFVHFDLEM